MEHIKTFEELKQRYTSYSDFETVSALKNGHLSAIFTDVIPNNCQCGAEFILNKETNNSLQCVDPNCPYKLAYSLSYFIEKMGFKGFGDESCKKLIFDTYKTYTRNSFLCVFLLPDDVIFDSLGNAQANLFLDIKDTIMHSSFKFSQTFTALGIPGLGKDSKLLEVLKSPAYLLCMLDSEDKIMQYLSIIGYTAESYKTALLKYKDTIFMLYLEIAPIVAPEGSNEVYVAITGSVSVDGKPYSRTEFIQLCESITDASGKPIYKLKESKNRDKVKYVIADTVSNSEKYRLGQTLNCLITADEFVSLLRNNKI